MQRSTLRRAAVAAIVSLMAVGLTATFASGSPQGPTTFDYFKLKDRLSPLVYPDTVREAVNVEMPDGETLYVEVVRPDPAQFGEGPWPTIMEISPYHGTLADRKGTRIFPDPKDEFGRPIGLTGYFAPRGYAVVMVDLRGTGRSTGCLDHIGQKDALDMKTVIEWAAERPWSNGRVGLTGHSYVGATQAAAAAQDPEGLVTIVPSAGLASMYDHQFNKGVPWLLQWAGPMFAYELLAMERDHPPQAPAVFSGQTGDNWENAPNPQYGCGWQNTSLLAGSGQVTGQYENWHAQRDWEAGAAAADIPIFMVHGVNDNAARIPAAEWYFEDRGLQPGDKIWIGQWDHGSTNGRCGNPDGSRALHPTCRFDQWKYALHAWFDKHLMQRNVATGPAVEVFLNGETPVDVTKVMDPETVGGKVFQANRWPPRRTTAGLFPDATDGSLKFTAPAEAGSATFSTTAEAVATTVGGGRATFVSEPVATDSLFAGLPQLDLHASVTNEISHLTATLFRVDSEGRREPMNFCGIQPHFRGPNGVKEVVPVVPGQRMSLPMQCFTMSHWVPAGHSLELQISTRTPHHASFGPQPNITVFTGPEGTRYQLPTVRSFRLRDDVSLHEADTGPPPPPVGPAQPGIQGDVIVPASATDPKIEPITAVGFEFVAEEGFDNARMEALATTLAPADIDLYLQNPDGQGGWETITSGTSFDFQKESLAAGRLPAGPYRILVHNWAGAPTRVHLEITFFNQNDEPGGSGGSLGEAQQVPMASAESFGGLPQP